MDKPALLSTFTIKYYILYITVCAVLSMTGGIVGFSHQHRYNHGYDVTKGSELSSSNIILRDYCLFCGISETSSCNAHSVQTIEKHKQQMKWSHV